MRNPSLAIVALLVALAPAAARAQAGPCPAAAAVDVVVANASADLVVTLTLEGRLVDPAATCTGAGFESYSRVVQCRRSDPVPCTVLTGLRPGAWINRIAVTVGGSEPQVQARRAVFVAETGGGSNALVWTVHPRTFVVTEPTPESLRTQLDAAAAATAGGASSALVTFARDAFPGAGQPRTIELGRLRCDPDPARSAALCFAGNRVVVDGLDADGRPGGVVLSVGAGNHSLLRLYGSDDELRGLVLAGSTAPQLQSQQDTVVVVGTDARRNRITQSIVLGPKLGDGVSVEAGAGGGNGGAIVIDDSELRGAQKKGLIVSTGGRALLRQSCVADNGEGGVHAVLGGNVAAVENLIQHNVPGRSGHGLAAGGGGTEPSVLGTHGNIVRFAGGRGLSIVDDAVGVFDADYVADNQFAGSAVASTVTGTGVGPRASFRGVALVCNRNAGVSGSCQPQLGDEGVPCATDLDCCGTDQGCCATDPNCQAPLTCKQLSFSRGFGAVQSPADGRPAPAVDYGDDGSPGRNAFAWNRNHATGANFVVNVPGATVPAVGNQWERCGPGATCDVAAVGQNGTGDVRLATGATVRLGTPPGPRAGTPTLTAVSPARPAAGKLVRVFGTGFNAVDGTACGRDLAPPSPCSDENGAVEQQNRQTGANRVRILTGTGTILATLYPHAVTPTMVAFRMPFDCFAPLLLEVSKRAPDGTRPAARIAVCDRAGCDGQPAGAPCDDGDTCTTDDRCSANGACIGGDPLLCNGTCLSGGCVASTGCLPLPSSSACEDGNACTVGDHCSGFGNLCRPGSAPDCDDADACTLDACDVVDGCTHTRLGAADGLTCLVASCSTNPLRTKLDRATQRLTLAATQARPKRYTSQLRAIRRLLRRCRVDVPRAVFASALASRPSRPPRRASASAPPAPASRAAPRTRLRLSRTQSPS